MPEDFRCPEADQAAQRVRRRARPVRWTATLANAVGLLLYIAGQEDETNYTGKYEDFLETNHNVPL